MLALSLDAAIEATADIGFRAIEIACMAPHLSLEVARRGHERGVGRVRRAGLTVSALSLFNNFTDPARLDEEVESAETFIRLAPAFGTRVVKMTPGPPGSADADEADWHCLDRAVARLVPVARQAGVRLAFETHMRQLTDTLASSQRLLSMAPSDVVGLTVDFSNLSFADEDMREAITVLSGSMINTHVKNGTIDAQGGWHFGPLDRGMTDYAQVVSLLREVEYDGYMTIECLGPDAHDRPIETARRDLEILTGFLAGTAAGQTGPGEP